LRPLGVGLGCGAVVVLGADGCGVLESARILAWLASQSAGQCGPCVHGLAAIAEEMQLLATGRGDGASLARLERWARQVEGRGACSFPDGAVRFLRSALHAFAADAAAHAARHPCGRRATLAVPAAHQSEEWR
jgi:NADH:ubiquinone oxidoreductase subunit F (NADH-binding)